jgi:hypothetical protein
MLGKVGVAVAVKEKEGLATLHMLAAGVP